MGYDTAQICLNGHVSATSSGGALLAAHCTRCGERNIIACEACRTPIKGDYRQDGLDGHSSLISRMALFPRYCPECGKSYPWTKRGIDAAKDMAEEFDELSREEKEKLKGSLDDLVADTPTTELAIVRAKKILAKLGSHSLSTFKEALIRIATEAAQRGLFGK